LFYKFTNIFFIESIVTTGMPFCTECGKELQPGQKFCTECGTPAESGQMPPPSSSKLHGLRQWFLSAGGPKKYRFSKKHAVAASLIIFIAVAVIYSIGVPRAMGSGSALPVTTAMTTIPTLQSPPDAPEWTLTPEPETDSAEPETDFVETETDSTEPKTLPPTPTPELTRMITFPKDSTDSSYTEVYSNIHAYKFGEKQEFSCTLTNPPLDIHFSVEPRMITREKLANIGTSAEHTVTTTYADPSAWFEVKVINENGGSVIERQGFNRDFSITPDQEFKVRMPGKYRVEMSGNAVTASVRIYSATA